MKAIGQVQPLFENRYQHVGADGDPDLRLDGVFAGAQELLDPQMLFYPLEKQFDLPALAVQRADHLWLQREVVGLEGQPVASVVSGHDAPQGLRIIFGAVEDREHTGLVAHHGGVDAVHRMGISTLKLRVGLCARDEVGLRVMNLKQAREVEVAPIEQIESSGLDHQVVEYVDLVGLAIGNANEAGYGTTQVQQCMQLDGGLGAAKRSPRVNRETQVDRRRIEGIDGGVQIHPQRFVDIQRSCNRDQVLRVVGINLPRSGRIRIGQRVARDRRAAKAHVVQALGLRAQVDLDVSQRLAVGQLRKRHCQKLIQARKVLDLVFAPMRCDAAAKGGQGQMRHDLRKNQLALMHKGSLRQHARSLQSDRIGSSNRDQTQSPNSARKSLTYKPST